MMNVKSVMCRYSLIPLLAGCLFIVMFAGCGPTFVRDIGREAMPRNIPVSKAHDCRVFVAPVADERPEYERVGENKMGTNMALPLLVYWYFSYDGPIYQDATNLGGEAVPESIRTGLKTALNTSGVCAVVQSQGDADFVITPILKHAYGADYKKSNFWVLALSGGAVAVTNDYHFYPLGSVVMDFKVTQAKTGSPVTEFGISEGTIFDKNQPGSSIMFSARGHSRFQMDFNRANELVMSFHKVFTKFPRQVELALMATGKIRSGAIDDKKFAIAKMDRGYEFMEWALVDAATGRVDSATQVRRYLPVFAPPGKWVVLPWQDGLLNHEEYMNLLTRLSSRFDIKWEDNLTAATFGGLK